MRRALIFIVALIAAVAVLVPTGAASAGGTVAYSAPTYSFWGPGGTTDFWTCSGFRIQDGAAVEDHFTCTVTDQTFSGTFSDSTPWPCGCTGWASDFDGQVATSYLIRVSTNGMVVGTAKY
jgi:hypothetical protein